MTERLQKILSQAGVASRRKAEALWDSFGSAAVEIVRTDPARV